MAHLSHFYLQKNPINYILVIVGDNMKKMIMFLLIFFIGIVGINAKDFNAFACEYNMTYSTQGNHGMETITDFGHVEIQVKDYDTDNPKVIIFHDDGNGNLVQFNGTTYDYKGNDNGFMLNFFTKGKKKQEFINAFNNNGKNCPNLIMNIGSIDYSVETSPIDPVTSSTFWSNSSYKMLVSATNGSNNDWKEISEFLKDDNVEYKEPRECPYTMDFRGMPTSSIKLTTNYEPGTNKESYVFSVNGNETKFDSLKDDVYVMMGTGTNALVRVTGSTLSKLYPSGDSKCPSKDDVFGYLDATLAADGVYGVTGDEGEAKDNGINGEYTTAGDPFPTTGKSNTGASLKVPTLTGFGSKGDKCDKVLGTTLASLVKEAIKWVRIAGGIIAIVNAMLKLIPAIMSKDAEALSKAARTCVIMAIILVFCALFPWLLNLIGSIFKWDVSCIV